MYDIIIISIGKIKERHWQSAIDEYLKRLQPYAKINIIEILEEPISSINNRIQILDKEGEKIAQVIPKDCFVIALDRVGQNFTSTEWSEKIDEWSRFGHRIVFIIGGPLGLSATILQHANVLISFSKMTFTHQMTRVILLEQLYRAVTISRGMTYHY
jgi:23S rRNA (pseudouridine1915-N3)-methyltransferase